MGNPSGDDTMEIWLDGVMLQVSSVGPIQNVLGEFQKINPALEDKREELPLQENFF